MTFDFNDIKTLAEHGGLLVILLWLWWQEHQRVTQLEDKLDACIQSRADELAKDQLDDLRKP